MIVLSAFVNFTLVGGNFMGFSLLYHSIAESMQATYAATGWVGSLSQGIMHISGTIFQIYQLAVAPNPIVLAEKAIVCGTYVRQSTVGVCV